MKKIIRIASVIALASASLLYVGCTKDFSADIAKTNQDVAALNQKVEALDATVQTINSTVANLQTTKADLSAVNAADQALDGKITALDGKLSTTKDELNAAIKAADQKAADAAKAVEAAAAKAAADLKDAKDSLNGVIKDIDAKIDSLNAISVAKTDSLRKDVDSLYANCAAFEKRIAALEGKVSALAERITSIVAVPSVDPEIQRFLIDSVGKENDYIDTIIFKSSFAVAPKTAVKDLDAENFKVHFKTGLSKKEADNKVDTVIDVKNIVKDEVNGIVTVFAPAPELTLTTKGSGYDYVPYYSLSYTGKDDAGEYAEYSEFVKADKGSDITLTNGKAVGVAADKSFFELKDADKILTDTIAFNAGDNKTFGKLLTTDSVTVAFEINNSIISAEELGNIVGKPINVKIDTTFNNEGKIDTIPGFKITSNGTKLYKATKDFVGKVQKISAKGFVVNGYDVEDYENLACELTENHTIGAKTVEYTLPSVTEPWTYTSWEKVSRTVSITDCEDVHNAVPADGITVGEGAFKITKDSGKGVDIAVTKALRNEEAKDTTYKVAFKHNVETLSHNDTVNFTINWQYTLEGRPADETIDLADVDTLAKDYTKGLMLAIDSKIVDKTFAVFDAAYDKAIDTTVVKNAIKAETSAINKANVYFEGDTLDPWNVSDGKVEVPAHTKAGAYVVELEAKVFGITYTYTYTINIDWTAALKLHTTPYVSGGVAKVDADTTGEHYTLEAMDFAKYIQVFNADTLAKGFDDYTVKFKAELEDSAKFAKIGEDTTYTIGEVTCPESAKVENGILASAKLNWGTYEGREVKITAYLTNAKDTVDSCTFALMYDKPVTSFTAGTQTIKRVAGQNAEAVLSKSFNITGLYHGDKNLIVDTTGAWINGKNYYGCEFEYDFEKASFKVNGEATVFAKGVDYTTDVVGTKNAAGSEAVIITFIGDNNNKNIEASIPVTLTYKYDYNGNEAYKDNVVIKVVNE